jgi:hypothetical protein
MSIPFRQHMDVLSKSPVSRHALSGQDAQKAPSGVAFSLGYFCKRNSKARQCNAWSEERWIPAFAGMTKI